MTKRAQRHPPTDAFAYSRETEPGDDDPPEESLRGRCARFSMIIGGKEPVTERDRQDVENVMHWLRQGCSPSRDTSRARPGARPADLRDELLDALRGTASVLRDGLVNGMDNRAAAAAFDAAREPLVKEGWPMGHRRADAPSVHDKQEK